MKLAKKVGLLLTQLAITSVYAQGWIQTGGHLVMTDGARIVVTGTDGNISVEKDTRFHLKGPNSRISFTGLWTNNSQGGVFTTNEGRVDLRGFNQRIGGSTMTWFPEVSILGFGAVQLDQHTLIGGGHNGGGTARFFLNNRTLNLNSYTLVINNPSPNAMSYFGTGGIRSDNLPAQGYGKLQWNIRGGGVGPVYRIPFVTGGGWGTPIRFDFTCNFVATQVADSGFVRIATYKTADVPVPNNRPLPDGVFHADNECQGENSERMVDRYWIVEDGGYSVKPDATLGFSYATNEWNTANNSITEDNIGAISWDAANSRWTYPIKGTVNTATNYVSYRTKDKYLGIWTLSDTTPSPRAQFTHVGKCENDSVAFSDLSVANGDQIVNWQWSFGNGALSGDQNPVAYYTPEGNYKVRLIIQSASGCQDTAYRDAFIYGAPNANWVVKDTCENTTVKYESFSFPGSGMLAAEYWDFGDGSAQASGKKVSHYYGGTGIPPVRLIVYNSNGCKDTMLRNVYIAPKPYAAWSASPDCEDVPIYFTNGSGPGAGSISGYRWNFGDGQRATSQDASIIYRDFGVYPVSMIVENSYGCEDTSIQNIEAYARAIAAFDYSPDYPDMLSPVTFTNNSQYDSLWDWSFGDGYFDQTENPVHAYNINGTYRVNLIANNVHGCADTTFKDIRVKSIPLYWIPTAFSPGNTDPLNEGFGLFTPISISAFHMQIYNRWGELIYDTTDPAAHWDGTVKGEYVMGGNYVYNMSFRNPEDEIQVRQGQVIVIR
ncbi:MAG: PKD domain-containing protein [Bacteroidetes bacterium]|nr:PKD domain-containing protein [Bacteroidota bacterium]MDA0942641.1 PKD domain-containing protein [Bacteroidota bacterium]MDA1111949.1 PKD domain-containing protein [Bacteroidota bacterium]